MKWKLLPVLWCVVFASGPFTYAQAPADTAFVVSATSHMVALHKQALGGQARLYNGSRYHEPIITRDYHPFFLSLDWMTGSVWYDGEFFENVPLLYDLLNDVLVTEHYPSGHPIQLVREKLRDFSIGGHHFEFIENNSVGNSLPRTGFYEVLYDGETKVVAARQKFMREIVQSLQVEVEYEEKNRYFVLRNGIFFPVKSKGSMLKLMDDRRQQLKKLLKQKAISFPDNRELAIKSLAEFYDDLR